MSVRYRLVQPGEFEPPQEHQQVGGDVYVAPERNGIEILDVNGVVDVLDWDAEPDEQSESFNGPPEPIAVEEEVENGDVRQRIKVLKPLEDSDGLEVVDMVTYRCERCGNEVILPLYADSGRLPEEPVECAGCERKGPWTVKGLTAEQAELAHRGVSIWDYSTDVDDSGFDKLWHDVREFIRDYWDSADPSIYHGLTAFALTTWVRPNLDFVPHLMLIGKTTGGKTRLLNTLKRVSYRGVVSASATPSSMFRMIDHYGVTFFVSEYHGLESETRQEVDNVVRSAQKRGELVTRSEQTGTGYEPMVFDPFTHAAIATQHDVADDIKNRCIQVRSSPADRDMPATFDDRRSIELRNRLLYARFRLLDSDEWDASNAEAYGYMDEHQIRDRSREKLLPMVTAAILWDKLDNFEPFVEQVLQQDKEAAAESEDALFVEVVKNLAHDKVGEQAAFSGDPYGAVTIPYSEIVEEYHHMTGQEIEPSTVGHIRKRLGLDKETGRNGTAIADPDLGTKLQTLLDDHNLAPLDERAGEASQRQLIKQVRVIIEELEDDDDGADVEEVLGEAEARGLDPERAEHALDKLRKRGEVYESQTGHVRRS